MDDLERAARAAALGRLAERFETVTRERSPDEGPVALTDAYVGLIVGCGAAHLGDELWAARCVAKARAAIAPVTDAVHGYLVDRLVATIQRDDHAIALLARRLDALSRVERYTVDRMRESAAFLGDPTGVDAIGTFESARGPIRTIPNPPPTDEDRVRIAAATARHEAERAAVRADPDGYIATVILGQSMSSTLRIAKIQMVFRENLGASHARAIAWTMTIAQAWPRVTDAFRITNKHFCVSVIAFADTLVREIVGL